MLKVKKCENNDFLNEVLRLDSLVYPGDLQGSYDSLLKRYNKNKEMYKLIYDDNNLIGYMCYFPISDKLSKEIRESNKIHDDDIKDIDITNYSKEKSVDLYVISIVIDPNYRDTDAIKLLTNSFEDDIKLRLKEGYKINNIYATAISDDGRKFLSNMNFQVEKTIEKGYTLMKCRANKLKVNIKNDIYIMIPFDGLYEENGLQEKFNYIENMDTCFKYECNNYLLRDLSRKYLGEKELTYMDDNYIEEKGKIKSYFYLTAHKETNLNILTIIIPNNKYSMTQIQDQVFSDHLYIDKIDINTYMRNNYNLNRCGDAKTVLCLSKKPKDQNEMKYMLAGETYMGEYNQKFGINEITSKEIDNDMNNNISQYNFYECYVSSTSLIYILKDFDQDFSKRIAVESLILFIVELAILQNAAIKRTNIKIVDGLSKEGNVSLKFIEDLYKEFGKTVIFWDYNNFKYSSSQNLANVINKSFKIDEALDTYYRNQNFLEHIVDLKSAQASNRENKILNIIAIILALLQVVPVFISFFQWLIKKNTDPIIYISSSGLITLLIIILIIKKKRNN